MGVPNKANLRSDPVRVEQPPPDAFRLTMRRLAAMITVITTRDRNRRFGMTATAVTSVTMAPPSLLVCVIRCASLHEPLSVRGRFCVNILKSGQEDVSRVFAGRVHP